MVSPPQFCPIPSILITESQILDNESFTIHFTSSFGVPCFVVPSLMRSDELESYFLKTETLTKLAETRPRRWVPKMRRKRDVGRSRDHLETETWVLFFCYVSFKVDIPKFNNVWNMILIRYFTNDKMTSSVIRYHIQYWLFILAVCNVSRWRCIEGYRMKVLKSSYCFADKIYQNAWSRLET